MQAQKDEELETGLETGKKWAVAQLRLVFGGFVDVAVVSVAVVRVDAMLVAVMLVTAVVVSVVVVAMAGVPVLTL